jgi:hypothetical protein
MTKPESYWNHRIMRTETPQTHELFGTTLIDSYTTYAVHEVYYSGNKIISWTSTPVEIREDSLKDLKTTLKNMLEACKLPVLDSITGEEIKTV